MLLEKNVKHMARVMQKVFFFISLLALLILICALKSPVQWHADFFKVPMLLRRIFPLWEYHAGEDEGGNVGTDSEVDVRLSLKMHGSLPFLTSSREKWSMRFLLWPAMTTPCFMHACLFSHVCVPCSVVLQNAELVTNKIL